MKIKEKAWRGFHWMKERPIIQKIATSNQVKGMQRLGATYQKNSFPIQVVLILMYRLLLDVLYLTLLGPIYASQGFTTNLMPLGYSCSWLLLLVLSPLIEKLNEDEIPSSVLVTFLNYLFFIPMTSYFGCKGVHWQFYLIGSIYWALLLLFQIYIPVVRLRAATLRHERAIFTIFTVCSALFVLYISGKYTGFRFTLNFIDVYDIRREARDYAILPLFRYVLSAMQIVIPIMILYWLKMKKYLVGGALCIVMLFLFSIEAQKSTFFFLLILLAGFALYHRWMLRAVPLCFSGMVCVALLEKGVIGTYYILSLFVHRMLYLPILIVEQYGQFFGEHPLNLFRDGFMGKFSFQTIYSTSIPRIMGEFRGHPLEGANSGLIGDLFANLPVALGVLVLPLILILCFRLLDLVTSQVAPRIWVAIAAYYACIFVSVSWATVLLSSGFLIACLLLYLFPKKREETL